MAKAEPSEPQAETPPAAPAPDDQDSLTLEELARAVLDRNLRPRAAAVRRLAEGVVANAAGAKGGKKGKKKKSASPGAKKGGGKKRKLAKIPGQQG